MNLLSGIITSARITHASPAALYAHSADRLWEYDADMRNENSKGCKDMARQLIEDSPGNKLKVLFGGGRCKLGAPVDSKCSRIDGRNLVEEWLLEKQKNNNTAKYVTNTEELQNLDVEDVDYIMGEETLFINYLG